MDIINLFSGGAFAAVLGFMVFIYTEFYKVPRLTYRIIRPYVRGDEKIVPIIFSNDGHANATDVKIVIICNGPIQQISNEEIPENITTENLDQNTLKYKLDRLTSKMSFITYITLSSLSDKPISTVKITSKEGSGRQYKPLVSLSFFDRIMLIFVSALFGALIMFILIVVKTLTMSST